MLGFRLAASVFCFALAIPVCACSQNAGADTHGTSTQQQDMVAPDPDDVEAFLGATSMKLPGEDSEGPLLISDRIMEGFEAAPSKLVMDDGTSVWWGFKFQEGGLQSVAIYDSQGNLKLLAVVDGIISISGGLADPIKTMQQYEDAVRQSFVKPDVVAFVSSESDLKKYLPVLHRWLQADLLGFQADCGKSDMKAECKLAQQIELPVSAYQVPVHSTSSPPSSLTIPGVAAADIPLDKFVQ